MARGGGEIVKILVIVGGENHHHINTVIGTPSLYAFYLSREFRRLGHDVVFSNIAGAGDDYTYYDSWEPPYADHAISCEQRTFANRHVACIRKLRERVTGCVATICDNNEITSHEDVVFYAVPAREKPGSKYIGWAADGDLIHPAQASVYDRRYLRFLVDHAYHGTHPSVQDRTPQIVAEIMSWVDSHPDLDVFVRQFTTEGPVTLPTTANDRGYSCGYLGAVAEYCKADVFFVTHAESLGLSVIEAAMAGALIVTPQEFIRPQLLADIPHHCYSGKPNWDLILDHIDPLGIRASVAKYNRWREIAEIMIKTFEDHSV